MTIHSTPGSRLFFSSIFLVLVCVLALLATHQIIGVHAARQSILKEDARVFAELAADPRPASTRAPVLVELFTSEGCSSCPPADALLAHLDRDQPIPSANIIVLEEHVDYWDSLGWRDRFSSSDITQRQRKYQDYFHLGDVFTPQIVVNGSAQFNGTDSDAIGKAIENAAAETVPLKLTGVQVRGDAVRFTLQNGPETPGYINLFAALVDPSDTTEVLAGENGGRTLHHAGVVREFGLIGSSWHTNELGRHPENPFTIQVHQTLHLDGMRLVVFAQQKHIGPVRSLVSCSLHVPPAHFPAMSEPNPPPDRCPDPEPPAIATHSEAAESPANARHLE